MSAKTILVPYNVVPPIAGNMVSTLQTSPTGTKTLDAIGYSIQWTGTPAGTFSVQCSNDYTPGSFPSDYPINAGTWTDITLSNTITAVGTPDNAYIDLKMLSSPWVRLVYTPSGGSGTLSVWVAGKSI